MLQSVPVAFGGFLPESGSTMAPHTDALFGFLLCVAAFFTLLICALIGSFVYRYHRRHTKAGPREIPPHGSTRLELLWTAVPLLIALVAFGWGANLFVEFSYPPSGARSVYVVAKQWMWKIQHPEGPKEINELHIPVGRPVRLEMVSEDVIHSFYVPAFRVKQDLVPGRYTSLWFEPTSAGVYDLYCAEYCGTNHSKMIGRIVVMEPSNFQRWLEGGSQETMAQIGGRLFEQFACASCHNSKSNSRGPDLAGLPGRLVQLKDGGQLTADDAYIRESIFNPGAGIVKGYTNLMPAFKGQIDEEGVIALIEHIKSLAKTEGASR